MNFKATLEILRRARRPLSPAEWKLAAARCAWAKAMVDRWSEAMRHRDEVCSEAVERLSEEEFNRLCDTEEAKVAAIRAEIDAVIERDDWPRELHFGGDLRRLFIKR